MCDVFRTLISNNQRHFARALIRDRCVSEEQRGQSSMENAHYVGRTRTLGGGALCLPFNQAHYKAEASSEKNNRVMALAYIDGFFLRYLFRTFMSEVFQINFIWSKVCSTRVLPLII